MNIANSFFNVKYETWVLRQNVRCDCIIEKNYFHQHEIKKQLFCGGYEKMYPKVCMRYVGSLVGLSWVILIILNISCSSSMESIKMQNIKLESQEKNVHCNHMIAQ